MASKRVAVIGASGYGGLQTLRLLQGHPDLEVTFLGGERSSGKRWSELTPFLPLPGDPLVQSPTVEAIAAAAQALEEALAPLVEALRAWLTDGEADVTKVAPVTDAERLSPQDLRQRLDELEARLRQLDPEAAELAAALWMAWAPLGLPAESDARQLVKQAEAFDFEHALQTLKRLRETTP